MRGRHVWMRMKYGGWWSIPLNEILGKSDLKRLNLISWCFYSGYGGTMFMWLSVKMKLSINSQLTDRFYVGSTFHCWLPSRGVWAWRLSRIVVISRRFWKCRRKTCWEIFTFSMPANSESEIILRNFVYGRWKINTYKWESSIHRTAQIYIQHLD